MLASKLAEAARERCWSSAGSSNNGISQLEGMGCSAWRSRLIWRKRSWTARFSLGRLGLPELPDAFDFAVFFATIGAFSWVNGG